MPPYSAFLNIVEECYSNVKKIILELRQTTQTRSFFASLQDGHS